MADDGERLVRPLPVGTDGLFGSLETECCSPMQNSMLIDCLMKLFSWPGLGLDILRKTSQPI